MCLGTGQLYPSIGLTEMLLGLQHVDARKISFSPYPVGACLEDAHLDQGIAHGTRVVLVGGEDEVHQARSHHGLEFVHHAEVVKDETPPALLVARNVSCKHRENTNEFQIGTPSVVVGFKATRIGGGWWWFEVDFGGGCRGAGVVVIGVEVPCIVSTPQVLMWTDRFMKKRGVNECTSQHQREHSH